MQSIHARKRRWILEPEPASKRQPEPLMGWISSEDTLNQIKLRFSTKEEAIAYAEKQGWEPCVMVERERKVKPRSYMDNFKYIPSEDGR